LVLQTGAHHWRSAELLLMMAPIRGTLDFLHRKIGKHQVRVFGEESNGFGFVQCESEQLFLAGESFTELIDQLLPGPLDLGEELPAVIGAEGGEGVLVGLIVFDTIGFHNLIAH
jgi:hypothetical protein